jgi:RNA polymerase sigma-70 factor (ECF subfamily)
MRLHLARADARFDDSGGIVLLRDQDRSRWDRRAIVEAVDQLERALRMRPGGGGPYALQAAIAACHAQAMTYESTDWPQIVALYDRLYELQLSPVVALNRAVALAEVAGAEPALAAIEPLAGPLERYHLFHAARAELLRRLERPAEAAAADRRALELATNPGERRLLEERLAAAGAAGGGAGAASGTSDAADPLV